MDGAQMTREMDEQPARLQQLIARCGEIGEQVRAVAPASLNGITLVARGSSDHAGPYAAVSVSAMACS